MKNHFIRQDVFTIFGIDYHLSLQTPNILFRSGYYSIAVKQTERSKSSLTYVWILLIPKLMFFSSFWIKLVSVSAIILSFNPYCLLSCHFLPFSKKSTLMFLSEFENSYCILFVGKLFSSTVILYVRVRQPRVLHDCNFTLATWLQNHLEIQMFNIQQLQQHIHTCVCTYVKIYSSL